MINLNDYVGKIIKADVEGDSGAFGGVVDVDPAGNHLGEQERPSFIIGSNGPRGVKYIPNVRPVKLSLEVTSADSDAGLLFVKPVKRSLHIIRIDLDGLARKLDLVITPDQVDGMLEPLKQELVSYPDNDPETNRVLAKYAAKLEVLGEEGYRKIETRNREQRLIERFSRMQIEPGARQHLDRMKAIARDFLRNTSTRESSYDGIVDTLETRLDQTLVGVIGSHVVAMLGYHKSVEAVADANYLDSIGLSELNPAVGKMFLSRAVPHLPLKKAYVALRSCANFSFFEQMGFVKMGPNLIGKSVEDKVNVLRAYVFKG